MKCLRRREVREGCWQHGKPVAGDWRLCWTDYSNQSESSLGNGARVNKDVRGRSSGQYVGAMAEGRPHGQGVCKFVDGTVYTGQWKQGRRCGWGACVWPDGAEYTGEWADDRLVTAAGALGQLKVSDGIQYEFR